MTASKTKAKSNPKQKFVINFNAAFILFATSFLRNVLRAVLLFIFYRDLIINYGPSQQALFTLSVTIATYANIVEAGVGSTIIISLYKHAKNHNYHTINRLLCGAKKVFRIITFIYIFCAVLIAIAFSLFLVPNGFYNPDYLTYFGMFVLVSCINIPGYLYGSKYDFLLSADIKSYVINTCNMIAIVNYICSHYFSFGFSWDNWPDSFASNRSLFCCLILVSQFIYYYLCTHEVQVIKFKC